jgi:uncharacterized membrane protein (UPF0127 family)
VIRAAAIRGALALVLAGIGICSAEPRVIAARPLAEFPREQVAIETVSARRHVFEAWRADTPETRAQGLMFVADIDASQAMIFTYEPPQRVSMWMRNTYISLDMLFADEYGCILRIVEGAEPESVDKITAPVPVAYVLELEAGTVRQRSISVGDRLVRITVVAKTQTPHRCTR